MKSLNFAIDKIIAAHTTGCFSEHHHKLLLSTTPHMSNLLIHDIVSEGTHCFAKMHSYVQHLLESLICLTIVRVL